MPDASSTVSAIVADSNASNRGTRFSSARVSRVIIRRPQATLHIYSDHGQRPHRAPGLNRRSPDLLLLRQEVTSRALLGRQPVAGSSLSRCSGGLPPCGRPRAIYPYAEKTMTDIGDGPFHKGEPVWVMQDDGSQRAAEYVGVRETSAWFGGAPTVIVVYPDTRSSAAVEVDRVVPRKAQD